MDLILNRVAWMYYYGDMKQQEIADRLHISRVTVNRLIKQARNEGIVEIRIRPDFMKMYEIEDELRRKSNLEYVIVVPETHDIEESLCRGAAHLINDVLDSRGNLGIGLSKTLKNLHHFVRGSKVNFEAIVSICGAAYPDLSMTPLNVGFTLADALNVSYYTIWAPVLVSEESDSQMIKKDKYISKVLEMAEGVDFALVGIGDVNSSQLTEIGYISDEELRDVIAHGAVGEIIGHYYDIEGKMVETPISERLISVDFPMNGSVIGVAGGQSKVYPILGALKTGYIQGLVVDEAVAVELCKHL